MATRQEIAKLYVATFNRAADASGLAYWDGTGSVTTGLTDIEDIAAAMLESPEAAALYAGLDREATVIKMYDNLFNRTVDGTDTGVIYWVSGGGSTVDLNLMIKALIDGALGADKTTINNKATVGTAFADAGLDSVSQAISIMQDVTSDSSSVTDAIKVINEITGTGNTYTLSTGTDTITGTDGDDMFEAYLGQNSTAGGVSNTLSSADKLAGGAGEDSLYAQIVPEFFGSTGDNQIDIQVRTSGIENVEFEARDSGSNDVNNNVLVTVDAKDMTGVEKIGSTYSDGDLVIENLTTLTDAGEIRHTSAMTITMDHTDNFNSDEDASDLTVYFDEDYLNTTTTDSGSSLTINMINSLNLKVADGSSLIEGFETITFYVDGNLVTVDVTGAELTDVQGLIEAAVADAGYTGISVSTYTEPAYFATNIYYEQTGTTYTAGSYAGTYTAFKLTNSGSEELTEGGFTIADGQNDGSLAYSQDDNEATTAVNPISINVELEKVGRDADGGNLIIGGKSQDNLASDTDVDQHDGINVFNITVIGDEDKPSNLGVIQSTNNELNIVTVASATGTDAADAAALTVRGDATLTGANANSNTLSTRPFGGTLTTFDANEFLGDLYIGQDVYASNIDTFTATGGGAVTLYEQISADNAGAGSFASLNANAYTVTTGMGSDNITIDANSGAQLTVTTGAGNDTISVSIDGQDTSGSDETYATISSSSGINTVTVTSADSTHDAKIDLGGDSDTVNGNSVNITVDTGAGDDVIYAENTGDMASVTIAAGRYAGVDITDGAAGVIANQMNESQFLNGREVTITVAMPEETTALVAEADQYVNGYEIVFDFTSANALSTEREFYLAIADAINNDAVVNKLAKASVDSNGNLTITYLVDGSTVAGEQLIQINISDEYALSTDIPTELLTAVREELHDSTITAAEVLAAYDDDTVNNYGATTGSAAQVVFDVSTLADGDDITITIDGNTDTVTGATTVEADLNGQTVTIGGIDYSIVSAAGVATLTQISGTPADLTAASIIDTTLGAAVAATTITDGVVGTNGTDSTSSANNVVNGGLDDDVIVLSSNDAAQDTVVFDEGQFGNDVIVHFEAGLNGDILDFSAFLDNTQHAAGSTSTISQTRVDGTASVIANMIENSVAVTDMSAISDNDAGAAVAMTFATLTNAGLLAEMNATAEFGASSLSATFDGTVVKSIMLVEDALNNEGFYNVYEVEYTEGTTNAFTSVELVGTIDFGETQAAFDDTNIA